MDYGFKQDIMRNNADMSKWASWQQQQTIDELKRLKVESSDTPGGSRVNGIKTLDAQSILSKNSRLLSKFTARKLSASTGLTTSSGGSSSTSNNGTISSLAGFEWPGIHMYCCAVRIHAPLPCSLCYLACLCLCR